MRIYSLSVCGILMLVASAVAAASPARTRTLYKLAPNAVKPRTAGVWRWAWRGGNKKPARRPGTARFFYDGRTVTLWLFSKKDWMWKSVDDHYRLKSKWIKSTLHYLPPFGRWQKLATWDNELKVFRAHEGRFSFRYRRIELVKELDPADRVLLKPRRVHDYRIKPTDPRPKK